MEKCIVKDCKNHRHDGLFVGDLCKPCHDMLTEGRLMPSEAWFVAEQRRQLVRGMEDYLRTWRELPEVDRYSKPSFDVWLASQLQRAGTEAFADASDWLPMSLAPLDGTEVDLWTVRGQRISNVRFIRGVDVDPRYAPGGEWAHQVPEDGWRTYEHKEAWLAPEQFTHFRYITGPNGQQLPQG